MPVIVSKAQAPRVVVVSRRATAGIAVKDTAAVIVDQPAPVATVRADTRAVAVVGKGAQGPEGPAGPVGPVGPAGSGSMPPIDFAFGDASPAVVLLVQEPLEVLSVSLQVEEAFDGTGAAVALGTTADPDLLLPPAFNAPGVLGVYETAPRAELPAGTEMILTIAPGVGATAGRGQLVITAVPIQ
ncbi:hypothetical protein [Stenotrophomonas acidaminiphila]|uniref:hypothetical protein n=1 Tax=Stenotrophomonas acidaminiphila TaxID=128780 RepID=UPI0028B0FDF0|nr:hypothetical protein [Stenotrophomonas acidaminiphila]